MTNINITIPEELHRELRIQAAQNNTSIKELVINTLKETVKKRGTKT